MEEQQVIATPENTTQPNISVEENQVQESAKDINWRQFREQRELERKQREDAERRAREKEQEAQALKVAMDAILNKPSPQNYPIQEEELDEDQRIEKKVQAALLAKEKVLEEERRRREQQEFPQRLASTYSDFNQVCTTENLDYLEYHYPEVASAFKHAPDGFDKWAAVYKAVKRFVPNTDSKKEQAKAERNFNKPQSMAVGGATQTGDSAPMYLDDKRRADNWSRMQRIMKGGR
jgi:hypothetical protein